MLVGRRSIRLKAEKVVSLPVDRKTNCDLNHNQTTCKIFGIQYEYFCQKKKQQNHATGRIKMGSARAQMVSFFKKYKSMS